jgi:predicted sugar kinase
MLSAVRLELLPALASKDWSVASQAIGRYGAMAGEIFRPLQGGTYRSPSIAAAVASLQTSGVPGVGQSSWGPTLFAVARDEDHAEWIAGHLRGTMTEGTSLRMTRVAGAASYGLCSSS